MYKIASFDKRQNLLRRDKAFFYRTAIKKAKALKESGIYSVMVVHKAKTVYYRSDFGK